MKRFEHLEFNESNNNSARKFTAKGEGIRDCKYFYKQGIRYWLNADFEPALRNFSRSLEDNPTFLESWKGQLLMLIELKEYKEVIIWADKALDLFPEDSGILSLKSIAYFRDNQVLKAVQFSDNALSKEKIPWIAWASRAEIMMKKKKMVAENCASKAIATAEDQIDIARFYVGRIFRMYGNYVNAMQYQQQAVRALPKSAFVWFELGLSQYESGFSEARNSLEQALKINPSFKLAANQLSKCKNKRFWSKIFPFLK